MSSIFTRIINGDLPSHKIAENDECLAFLDVNPLHRGHTLVVPKKEMDYIFDIDDDLYEKLWLFARKVAHAIGKAIPCERVGVAVIGLEVPHAHIHLVPINSVADIDFSKPKKKFSEAEFEKTVAEIRRQF